jgi:hypothetical protein
MTILTLIYLQDTGNALAAVTRATAPAAAEPVAALVGPRLPFQRAGDQQHAMAFTITADRLAVATFDKQPFPDVPARLGVSEQQQNQQITYTLVTLADGSGVGVTPEAAGVTVTVPTATTAALPVLVVLQKELASPPVPAPVFLSGSSPAFASQVKLTATLDQGTWNAVAFVKGYSPSGGHAVVP